MILLLTKVSPSQVPPKSKLIVSLTSYLTLFPLLFHLQVTPPSSPPTPPSLTSKRIHITSHHIASQYYNTSDQTRPHCIFCLTLLDTSAKFPSNQIPQLSFNVKVNVFLCVELLQLGNNIFGHVCLLGQDSSRVQLQQQQQH